MSGDKPLLYETLRERVYAQEKKLKILLLLQQRQAKRDRVKARNKKTQS
jgi:hypothetical protein